MNKFTKNKHLKVLLCYGSQNGYAHSLAQDIYNSLSVIDKSILSMNEVNTEELHLNDYVIFVLSTSTEGSFPKNSDHFYYNLKNKNNNLNFKYFIVGIGDSSYTNFCMPAKKLNSFLSDESCIKALESIYLDDGIDHEEEYIGYKNSIIQIIKDEESDIKKWFTDSMNTNLT